MHWPVTLLKVEKICVEERTLTINKKIEALIFLKLILRLYAKSNTDRWIDI